MIGGIGILKIKENIEEIIGLIKEILIEVIGFGMKEEMEGEKEV